MTLLWRMHEVAYAPRVRVLSEHLAEIIPSNSRVLDVGCGDGLITHRTTQKKPSLELSLTGRISPIPLPPSHPGPFPTTKAFIS